MRWKIKEKSGVRLLLDGLGVWPWDGVAVEEGEELAEGVKERPVREQTDALVGVDGALGGAAAAAAEEMVRGGAAQAQAGALLIRQTLLREGLVELNGGAVDLKTKWSHELSKGCTTPIKHQFLRRGCKQRANCSAFWTYRRGVFFWVDESW